MSKWSKRTDDETASRSVTCSWWSAVSSGALRQTVTPYFTSARAWQTSSGARRYHSTQRTARGSQTPRFSRSLERPHQLLFHCPRPAPHAVHLYTDRCPQITVLNNERPRPLQFCGLFSLAHYLPMCMCIIIFFWAIEIRYVQFCQCIK